MKPHPAPGLCWAAASRGQPPPGPLSPSGHLDGAPPDLLITGSLLSPGFGSGACGPTVDTHRRAGGSPITDSGGLRNHPADFNWHESLRALGPRLYISVMLKGKNIYDNTNIFAFLCD